MNPSSWWSPWTGCGLSVRRHLIIPALVWLVVTMVWESSGLDVVVMDAIGGPTGFPLRHAWLLEGLLHNGGKWLVVVITVGAVLGAVAARWWQPLRPWWRPLLVMAAVVVAATSTVAILKALTGVHCPWDLQRYGGQVPMQPWWAGPPEGFKPGKGWPAGHASAGFSLLVLYVVALPRSRQPWRWLLPGLTLGCGFATTQVLRGAHFPSHNLYTIAICWCWALVLSPLARPARAPSLPPVQAPRVAHAH